MLRVDMPLVVGLGRTDRDGFVSFEGGRASETVARTPLGLNRSLGVGDRLYLHVNFDLITLPLV